MQKLILKAIVIIVLFFTFSEVNAQMSAGGGVVYGTEINNIGISAIGRYQFTEDWSAAPSFTYFLKKDGVSWSSLDLDANYKLTEIENVGLLYGIGGFNVTFYKVKIDADLGEYGDFSTSASGSEAGVNLGLGLNVAAGENLIIAPEVKYTLNVGYVRFGVNILFGL